MRARAWILRALLVDAVLLVVIVALWCHFETL